MALRAPNMHELVALASAALLRAAPLRCRVMSTFSTGGGSCAAASADVRRLADGTYFNRKLGALNVFEIDVDESIIDEAADIFYGRDASSSSDGDGDGDGDGDHSPFAGVGDSAEPYTEVATPAGNFFTQRVSGWRSNIAWVSVDDEHSFQRFEALFERLELPQRFSSVIPHLSSPRLFSAFYVCRSWCEAHSFHTDYMRPVGLHALTLITPLRDYQETDSFQLTYKPAVASGAPQSDGYAAHGSEDATEGRTAPPALQRYAYKKGKAIVFGSRFEHSTEPGAGDEGEVHAYLCFTFGTDDQSKWADIAQTLDTQSRIVQHPDGELRLSALGRAIEAALRDLQRGSGGGGAEHLSSVDAHVKR
ncbi:hypothetical protein EMIHUDRAFT_114691 [Emiliania huxleyi CCMP1516]|uniref:Prolyl 4-hydroxylase alpha subunit Fe(2+) 2OG dioxygenase domain-containing protein n=2 Tax=Emiliania huxleyi TaxID=2903 RepID=A0A0D3JUZ4_EMIH1|nr:hypothetical protein EMIHUDRAFT_114691 [Emiliania huxleyi CCMP1516]EOD27329.1 hypothetical protein EMIHUDRAFT_114691 [Emiliania huxleyi CCMP1516]|eukprot:XP_005779758.1 hypothetical protein EMIHUDRAFT_114691 [Emiliania huxleyi CCMP1516]